MKIGDYDPVECLREEVKRFKDTNTFTPMLVTGFYLQAAIVLDEHKQLTESNRQLREELEKMKQCKCVETAPTYPHFRSTAHLPGCQFYEMERQRNEHIADKHRILREYEQRAVKYRTALAAAKEALENARPTSETINQIVNALARIAECEKEA